MFPLEQISRVATKLTYFYFPFSKIVEDFDRVCKDHTYQDFYNLQTYSKAKQTFFVGGGNLYPTSERLLQAL